jgi:hypothetical protein
MKFATGFREFYPLYVAGHQNRLCRLMHFVGSALALAILGYVLVKRDWQWLLAVPLAAHGLAWIGHVVFEKNRPLLFVHPLKGWAGAWVMFWHMLTDHGEG